MFAAEDALAAAASMEEFRVGPSSLRYEKPSRDAAVQPLLAAFRLELQSTQAAVESRVRHSEVRLDVMEAKVNVVEAKADVECFKVLEESPLLFERVSNLESQLCVLSTLIPRFKRDLNGEVASLAGDMAEQLAHLGSAISAISASDSQTVACTYDTRFVEIKQELDELQSYISLTDAAKFLELDRGLRDEISALAEDTSERLAQLDVFVEEQKTWRPLLNQAVHLVSAQTIVCNADAKFSEIKQELDELQSSFSQTTAAKFLELDRGLRDEIFALAEDTSAKLAQLDVFVEEQKAWRPLLNEAVHLKPEVWRLECQVIPDFTREAEARIRAVEFETDRLREESISKLGSLQAALDGLSNQLLQSDTDSGDADSGDADLAAGPGAIDAQVSPISLTALPELRRNIEGELASIASRLETLESGPLPELHREVQANLGAMELRLTATESLHIPVLQETVQTQEDTLQAVFGRLCDLEVRCAPQACGPRTCGPQEYGQQARGPERFRLDDAENVHIGEDNEIRDLQEAEDVQSGKEHETRDFEGAEDGHSGEENELRAFIEEEDVHSDEENEVHDFNDARFETLMTRFETSMTSRPRPRRSPGSSLSEAEAEAEDVHSGEENKTRHFNEEDAALELHARNARLDELANLLPLQSPARKDRRARPCSSPWTMDGCGVRPIGPSTAAGRRLMMAETGATAETKAVPGHFQGEEACGESLGGLLAHLRALDPGSPGGAPPAARSQVHGLFSSLLERDHM